MKLKSKAMAVITAIIIAMGCSSVVKNKYMIVSTQSGIGFQIGVKETNQTPEAKLGYIRSEMAFIPVQGDRVAPVLAKLNFKSIWATEGGISSVIATGEAATNEAIKTELLKDLKLTENNKK